MNAQRFEANNNKVKKEPDHFQTLENNDGPLTMHALICGASRVSSYATAKGAATSGQTTTTYELAQTPSFRQKESKNTIAT